MEQINLFADDFHKLVGDHVQFLQLDTTDVKETNVEKDTWTTYNVANLTCSYCRVEFLNSAQQREHYKLDWHRYNLKQSLLSRQPLTEEEFSERTGDISSISGSESEKEDSFENVTVAQGKIFLKSTQGRVFAIYRCLLFEKKEELEDDVLFKRLQAFSVNRQWTLFMLGGGHFAGGVFQGTVPVLHKTFHCYTVRAGQGSSQGARDNRSGGSQPKSAGASLRRYNETALVQHVRDIVEQWKDEIIKSSLIIFRAAGPYNRAVLFGGKMPLLNRSDSRLRTIPFSTRRATFTELKRVHSLLTTLYVYESPELALQQLPKQESEHLNKRGRSKATNINRSKSRESVERSLPIMSTISSSSEDTNDETNKDKQLNEVELVTTQQEISFRDVLESFEDTLSPEQRKKGYKKTKKVRKSKNQRLREREALRKKEICETIKLGNVNKLEELLNSIRAEQENEVITQVELTAPNEDKKTSLKHQIENMKCDVLNAVLDDRGNTLLHIAAICEQAEMVRFLLEQDADPCSKNDKQQTPYTCNQNKEIRLVFKDFAQEFPEKYNYNKAQIPISVPTSEEQIEKKKMQRKAKREKEKQKKKQHAIKKQEDQEQQRFLKLSDREKRALAAERRILSQSGTVTARCFLCATDMSGKIPFEYSGNRFCSVECLKAHRLQNSVLLPQ